MTQDEIKTRLLARGMSLEHAEEVAQDAQHTLNRWRWNDLYHFTDGEGGEIT